MHHLTSSGMYSEAPVVTAVMLQGAFWGALLVFGLGFLVAGVFYLIKGDLALAA